MNNFSSQMSLFATAAEKGAGEWATFSGARENTGGMFRVRQPEQVSRYSVTTLKRPARPQSLFFNRQTNQ